jgi:hypothetical protein
MVDGTCRAVRSALGRGLPDRFDHCHWRYVSMRLFRLAAVGALLIGMTPALVLAQAAPPNPPTELPKPPAATSEEQPKAPAATTAPDKAGDKAAPAAPAGAQSAPAEAKPQAAPGTGRPGPLAACRGDIAKLCRGKPGGINRCLNENAAQLSPECTAARGEIASKTKAMRQACAGDVRSLCRTEGRGKGGGGIVQCLRSNEAKLSPACSAAFRDRYAQ